MSLKARWKRSGVGLVLATCLAGALRVWASQEDPGITAGFDIPTGAPPSPLFGAVEFTSKMLLFEEFGTQPVQTTQAPPSTLLPTPANCVSGPDPDGLDTFLASPLLFPLPGRTANETLANPWQTRIRSCIPSVTKTVMDGRPPGEFFAHQRYSEFPPRVFFQSAQTGARVNRGLRDRFQRHGYAKGEFAPGGLYFNGGSTRGTQPRLHPLLPVQDPNAVWTFDGTFPPKLLMARYGEPILFRHHNGLPIDAAANFGFGLHTITTHEHNGHNPAESDGYTGAFSFPGEFYDYLWPMVLSGHDSFNTAARDPKAAMPDGNGGNTRIPGDPCEIMSTHWFHDHMLDFTAQNVYKGDAAMSNFYSAVDRGREPRDAIEAAGWVRPGYGCSYANPVSPNLCLPSGSALDWGNRDYDVNLVVADKAWDRDGQLFFNIFNTDGFLGDRMTVNFQYKPFLEVRARRYRFRILNGSVSRFFAIALVDQRGNRVPFHMVANDGNIMEHAVPFPNAESPDLPPQAIGERYDIVVDFARFKEGDKLYFVNLLEHKDGKGPNKSISLADVVGGRYRGDPAVGKFLEFRVRNLAKGQRDLSMNPVDFVVGKNTMIRLPNITAAELATARQRTFEFGRSEGTDRSPWTIKIDKGRAFGMDVHRVAAAPRKGAVEIWHLKNGGNGWSHPVHIHFEEGKILKRGGKAPPLWEVGARKDIFRIGPLTDDTGTLDVAVRFREFAGSYVEHCHNTQHEDHAMMLRWDLFNPGQTVAIPAPIPNWDGVKYEPSFLISTARQDGEILGVVNEIE